MRLTSLPVSTHPRFTFRPIGADDIEPWVHYLHLPDVQEHTSWDHPSPAELATYLGNEVQADPASLLRLAIATRADNRFVGTMGLHTVSPVHRSAELAYDLDPAFWGQGIVSSLGAQWLDWAHTQARLVRVQATVLASNRRSIATLDRLGFVREGLLRAYRTVRGRPGDFHMYAHVVHVS